MDASSGTTDGTLALTDAFSSLECLGGGMLEENQAGERGGALYATRGAKAKWYACHSFKNSASLGAAIYASHSVIELREGSTLSNDKVSGWVGLVWVGLGFVWV